MAGKVSSDPNIFLLPDLGEGLEEAELIEWCVNVGDRVDELQVLAKMETDKALSEVSSPRAGVIAVLHGKPGDRIKTHTPLVTFAGGEGGAAPAKTAPPSPAERGTQGSTAAAAGRPAASSSSTPQNGSANGHDPADPEDREDAGTVVGSLSGDMPGVGGDKVRAAPAVRRLARDLGVDINSVRGTGIGGRVTAKDVERAAQSGGSSAGAARHEVAARAPRVDIPAATVSPVPSARVAPAPAPAAREPDLAPGADSVRIPFRGVRRTIAEHLTHSVHTAVHFTVFDVADVTALDLFRRRLVAASGEKVSMLPFVAAAAARVLSGEFGASLAKLNATVDDKAGEIVQHRAVHLGIAVDTDNGLMVPIMRHANRLGVLEIARGVASLAKSARDRTIPVDQLRGGTFTITNFGSYAGRFGTPIINYPEVGILGVGRMYEDVVVRDGMIGVGKILPLSLAADHRVVDGSASAQFLAKIIELLQAPDQLVPAAR